MRRYSVSLVCTARRVTSVEPPGRFRPPTTLKLSGFASFHAGLSAGSMGGGALALLETSTLGSCASSGPAKNPAASPVLSAIVLKSEIRECRTLEFLAGWQLHRRFCVVRC